MQRITDLLQYHMCDHVQLRCQEFTPSSIESKHEYTMSKFLETLSTLPALFH